MKTRHAEVSDHQSEERTKKYEQKTDKTKQFTELLWKYEVVIASRVSALLFHNHTLFISAVRFVLRKNLDVVEPEDEEEEPQSLVMWSF